MAIHTILLKAMAATVARAHALAADGREHATEVVRLADAFCHKSRRTVARLFHDLWHNDDVLKYRTALDVLDGKHRWLEEELMEVNLEQSPMSAAPEPRPSPVVASGS